MTRRSLAFVFLLVGCAPHAAPADAGGPACPAIAPHDGDACSAPDALCVYEHCSAEGVVAATCTIADAGAGHWAVAATPCGACSSGAPCAAGTVCSTRESGAQITSCGTHTCGVGPLTCDCACGAGTACTLERYAGTGPIYTCMVGCGASVCP